MPPGSPRGTTTATIATTNGIHPNRLQPFISQPNLPENQRFVSPRAKENSNAPQIKKKRMSIHRENPHQLKKPDSNLSFSPPVSPLGYTHKITFFRNTIWTQAQLVSSTNIPQFSSFSLAIVYRRSCWLHRCVPFSRNARRSPFPLCVQPLTLSPPPPPKYFPLSSILPEDLLQKLIKQLVATGKLNDFVLPRLLTPSFHALHLPKCKKITDAGFAHITATCSNLKEIDVSGCINIR